MATTDDPPRSNGPTLEQFVLRAVDEVGATLNAALVVMGDKLSIYQALAGAGPLTTAEAPSGRARPALRLEWLNASRSPTQNARPTYPRRQRRRESPDQEEAMSSRTYRAALAAVLTSLAALTLAAPAGADDPRIFLGTPGPVVLPELNRSTGEGYCEGFTAVITFTDVKQYIIHQTTDPDTGDLTLQITGRARATVTNQTTGESVTFNISGPGTVVLDSAFNILSADAHGPNLLWTEQRFSFPGVPTISYTTGHVTFAVDRATRETTSYNLAGGNRQTDVCAVLAS